DLPVAGGRPRLRRAAGPAVAAEPAAPRRRADRPRPPWAHRRDRVHRDLPARDAVDRAPARTRTGGAPLGAVLAAGGRRGARALPPDRGAARARSPAGRESADRRPALLRDAARAGPRDGRPLAVPASRAGGPPRQRGSGVPLRLRAPQRLSA